MGRSGLGPDTFIIGVDPGNTTGICIFGKDSFTAFQLPAQEAYGFLHGYLEVAAERRLEVFLGIEKYMIGSSSHKKTSQPAVIQISERLIALAAEFGAIARQFGAGTTKQYTDKVLRETKAYQTGLVHANDATRAAFMMILQYFPHQMLRILVEGVPQTIAEEAEIVG